MYVADRGLRGGVVLFKNLFLDFLVGTAGGAARTALSEFSEGLNDRNFWRFSSLEEWCDEQVLFSLHPHLSDWS
jgi:hypothetical protein